MITIKEFAESQNKTYQAVSQQMKRKENKDKLEGHVHTEIRHSRKVKVLDDTAMQILKDASMQAPVILSKPVSEELESLKQENKNLLIKLAAVQEELNESNKENKQLLKEKVELLENEHKSWLEKLLHR